MSAFDINDWRGVPNRVCELLPQAEKVRHAHEKAAVAAGILPIGCTAWEPLSGGVTVYTPEKITEKAADIYVQTFSLPVESLLFRSLKTQQPDPEKEILVKIGSVIPGTGAVWNTSNKLLGGPNPLTNGIVASLLLGGAGYGGGALLENLFPERYLERGKLRRTLGLAGVGAGLGMGALAASSNARAMRTDFLRGLLTDNRTIPPYLQEALKEKQSFAMGMENPMVPGDTGLFVPKIPVPQFNAMVWNDVQKGMMRPYGMHTSPQIGAATTGLMGGLATQARSPIISPATVINGIASAGVGLATANLAGRALSALAGLTPEAQNKLQDMGLYAGVLHAIIPPMFGGR